ncbi:nucleolin isoform X2 [Triticum aestivum]|uniref:nucleolin isoform X2 n=1 Tax=Triticum aestivum TaxID=4565 RepID=UPI001D00F309|nr:nucleolin-like isoform X2 [Triticum aestivum]
MAPAAGRGRGRGRARGRGRGRGRGRAAKTPPPPAAEPAPEEAPDAAQQEQEQEHEQEQEQEQLTHTQDAAASASASAFAGRETIEISDSPDASPQPSSPDISSSTTVHQHIKDEEPSSITLLHNKPHELLSEADMPSASASATNNDEQQQQEKMEVEAGEPHDTPAEEQEEEAVPTQEEQEAATDADKQTVQNEAAQPQVIIEQEGEKADDDDDVAVKTDVPAHTPGADTQNEQHTHAINPLHQGQMLAATHDDNSENKHPFHQQQMDAEQEEEDPEEVIFDDSVSVGEGQAASEIKQGEDDDGQAAAESKQEEHRARAAEAAAEVKQQEDERKVMSDMANNRQRKKELEIFVGGLDREAVEEDIRKVFAHVGDVVEVRLHKDLSTNKNKGFAFVRFANKHQVARALAEVKNPMIHGKRCGVAASEDNDTLFLGNICNTWTKEAIKKRLLDYGVEGVQSLTLVPDTQNEGQSRGFAFLEFSCHADAMLAFKRLQQPDALFGHPERTAKVAFAEPIKEADAQVMAQVKSVFIDGLPPYWDEERVKNRFRAYGLIERVVLARNMPSAKRNDFGFVNFSTHEEALACIEATNNTELGDDGKAKLKVRVRLSNPLPKSQAVKGEMSGGFRIGHPGSGFNRPGRGFNRGRAAPRREGFYGDRGFNTHTPGRGGRFNSAYSNNSFEASPSDFRARQAPPAFRGGRWEPSSGRQHDFFDRGHGRGYHHPPRGPTFEPEGDFGRPFGENPYLYEDVRHGAKRPYSHMEPGPPGYFEHGPPRVRPRFDHYEQPPFPGGNRFGHYDQPPFPGGDRHRDSFGTRGGYSRDHYGPGPGHPPPPAHAHAHAPPPAPAQYGRGAFRPHHRGGGHSGGGYYHH